MKYVLIGFKSCGKTQFGQYLAQKLELPFIDIDHKIEEKHLQKTKESLCYFSIFSSLGEKYFRSLEKLCIQELQAAGEAVISTGGGSLLDPENTNYLQKIGTLIYLHASKESLLSRIQKERLPGFIDAKDFLHSFDQAFEKRTKVYEEIAQVQIDIDGKTHFEMFSSLEQELFKEAIVG